jgi:non-specific serine/threonine protein kinase/serine/threonine-protein kinase
METLEKWRRIKRIVADTLERPPAERTAFLDRACGADQTLRDEVESLLAAHADAGPLSEGPVAGAPTDVNPPEMAGPYRLLEKIGEGGMGQVWLAEQTAPLRRTVALKLIRAGLYDASARRRFQSERQSLAIMNHPAIAKVLDAGTTADGQPYFAMEYVAGPPITAYCDAHTLDIRRRIELFLLACEGVQHAHQKTVIHRDLKPANILVVEVDGKPVPRIIDFGLAKLDAPEDPDAESLRTRVGTFVGTPGYMSPEQADPSNGDLDTRSDVYSLGIILYELLTGSLPFGPDDGTRPSPDGLLQRQRDDDPSKPSARIGAIGARATAVAGARATEPSQLARVLRGDPDCIVMKAIEKDRDRRYATTAEFAADLRRYLNNEPILARPASAAYRLRKHVRRHRLVVGAAAVVVCILAGFSVVQAVELRRITRERDRADRITGFMTDMFRVSDPRESLGNVVTARAILDKASKDIAGGLAQDPELRAQMMGVMGEVYSNLGLYSQAESLTTQSLDVRRRLLGPADPDVMKSMSMLVRILMHEARFQDGEKVAREAFDLKRRVLGAEHPETLSALNDLAALLSAQGRYPAAEAVQRQVLAAQRRVLGSQHPDTLLSMGDLALTLRRQGHYAESEALLRERLDVLGHTLGPDHPTTLVTMNNLASTLTSDGRYAEAERLLRAALEAKQRVLGPEHPSTLSTMSALATNVLHQKRYAEAERLHRQALSGQLRVLGPENGSTLMTQSLLAMSLVQLGRYDEADRLLEDTIGVQRRVLGPDDANTAASIYNLAIVKVNRGDRVEAFRLLSEAVTHGLSPSDSLGLEKDPDLESLHGDPRFDALVGEVRSRVTAAANRGH